LIQPDELHLGLASPIFVIEAKSLDRNRVTTISDHQQPMIKESFTQKWLEMGPIDQVLA